MRIWNVLGRTDPAHTKQFTRAGGFKGTAVKPMWANKQMTEFFGPCGIGWGMDKPDFQVVPALDELMVYCTVKLWYKESGMAGDYAFSYGVGGDKVVVKQSSGLRTDDEAFKKAYTDALSNAMKFIGVAADVHMGMFDDNKYVQDVRNEFEEEKKKEVFAEVERQKEAAKVATTAPSNVGLPPELDWSYNKSSGVLICKPMDVKKSNKKTGDGQVITVQMNNVIDGQKFLYYFKNHADQLMGCVGKVCKFSVVASGKFMNIDEVLEIDGVKMEDPKEDLETQCRLLASLIGLEEEELREIYSTIGKTSWTVVFEMLRQRKSEMDAGVEVGAR